MYICYRKQRTRSGSTHFYSICLISTCLWLACEFHRFEDSTEYKLQQEEERLRHELKAGKAWMNWAIVAAVIVVLGVIMMIVVAVAR